MIMRLALLQLWRSRARAEFRVLSVAMILAVFSVTLLSCLTQSLGHLFLKDATSLLGADLIIESAHPIPEKIKQTIEQEHIQYSQNVEFFSMLVVNDKLQLTNVNAISTPFPLQGELRISQADNKASVLKEAPPPGEIWLDRSLANKLEVKLNDAIQLGNMILKFTGIIEQRPLAMSGSNVLAPLCYVNMKDLAAMAVLQPGSRATYRLLLAGQENRLKNLQATLESEPLNEINWITPQSGRRGLGQTLATVERYVSLIMLIQVFLAGIAIALSAHQFSSGQKRQVALMRCLGASSRTIFAVHLLELCWLALIVVLIGIALGYAGALLLLKYAQTAGFYAATLNWQGGLLGALTGFILLLGFAFPPIYELKKISPAKIFQDNFVPDAGIHFLSYALAIVALAMLFFVFVSEPEVAFQLMIKSSILGAFIYVAAWGVWFLFEPLSRIGGLSWRFGVSYLIRHRSQTISQWLVFAFVIMLLMLVQIIKQDFIEQWRAQLPTQTPNYFLVNVQNEQLSSLQQWLDKHDIHDVTFYPVVRARMSHINGQEVGQNRGLSRPINLTWMEHIPNNNHVVAGNEWGPSLNGQAVVSVENGFAKRQQLKMGDTVSFQIEEDLVTAKIVQLRTLEWTSFTPNFFVIFPDNVLEKYAHSYITSIYVPKNQKPTLFALAKDYVEISIIDIDDILHSIRNMINQLSNALEGLLLIVFALGILIMYASLLSSLRERLQESAMLQILGAKKVFIGKLLMVEFGLLGLFSGLVGSAMAMILAKDLATRYFAMTFTLNIKWLFYGTLLSTAVIIVFGLVGARKVFRVSPLWLLRQSS
ncbi:ABC transporter permease [Candidatus Berkiella aquae]|uniref:FtsX-like permease family protein n=1 Tax=Candidatus Berkiella aquae TaxID=295108 RepID=A0AAE3L8T3_9GAMM|nr:FtsX-like permease family protein [Candidatus Berkiella aquae]MCS5712576.1 FtsX-like permease family protein [Candidatus Berkiella aquae]